MIAGMLCLLISEKIVFTKFAQIHGKRRQFPEVANEDCGSSPDG